MYRPPHSLTQLPFRNSFATLPPSFYTRVRPTPFVTRADLVHFNTDAAALLDLDPAAQDDPRLLELASGTWSLPGSDPLASVYAGHQFGQYVPQLGDGRAILLGETVNQRGESWELQLKGSGPTPYSRGGDGRAALRSSIREYLGSEALQGLGIPTTRGLALVGHRDPVRRERIETGAVLVRLAPSHVRFGSFEYFYYQEQEEAVRTLADYILTYHFPAIGAGPHRYVELLQTVIERTARLIAQWQSVGFAHGVLNTDNMSILGLTLDYGPFRFMERYDPGLICNHSDHQGRYAFDRQPHIGLYNLSCLAQTFLPLIEVETAEALLGSYEPTYRQHYSSLMHGKLGLPANAGADTLIARLLTQLQEASLDYTLWFRALAESHGQPPGCGDAARGTGALGTVVGRLRRCARARSASRRSAPSAVTAA